MTTTYVYTLLLLLLLMSILWRWYPNRDGFLPYWVGYDVGFPRFQAISAPRYLDEPDVVFTSGTDTLTPLPYWVEYGAPGYWPYSISPYWYYDIPWYGPINTPWVGPSPWVGGRQKYRPGHGPGYTGVASGGGGGGHGGSH